MPPNPSSFSKSLYFGHIPEELIFPYPSLGKDDRENLKLILDSLHKFAAEKIDSAKIDDEGKIDRALLDELAEMGLCGLVVDEKYGGIGLSVTAYARVFEDLAAIDSSIAVTLGAHQSIGYKGILLFGNDEQKARYLPRLASGKTFAAFCLTEPTSGSDAASIKTRAVEQPDGSFLLSGSKLWITNGSIADVFTVFAQTTVTRDGESKDRITGFIVERGPGVTHGPDEKKLGIKGSATAAVYFDNVRVPKENVLGSVGGGFKVAMGILNNGRLSLAAGAVGVAKHVTKLSLDHAVNRRQFGRPIASFGLIKDKIAQMVMDTYAAESMVYLTTGLVDRGVEDYALESACCKVYGSEMLWRVVNESLQIAAGVGYMKEYPYERILRDARINLIFEGANEVLRCFIALSGMQGPGERLAQLADAIRYPLRGYGLAVDFVLDKIKTQYYGGEGLSKVHPQLKKEAVLFEDWVPELAKNVEKTLRKHGREISEMQFVQRRIADITIDLYLMIACISRCSMQLENHGPAAEREAKICRATVRRAAARIKKNIRDFEENDDELLKSIAQDTYEQLHYPFDLVLDP